MKNKNFLKGALFGALIMLLAVGVMGCIGTTFYGEIMDAQTERTLGTVNSIISKAYLYEDDIDRQAMYDEMIAGYVRGLDDPYSEYYNAEDTQALMEALDGEMCGLGVLLTMDMNTYMVSLVEVYENTPAQKAGMKKGDIIYKIDGEIVQEESLDDVVALLHGEEGTTVKVTVLRGEELKEIDCIVTRAQFTVPTVEWEMKEDHIGYLRIVEFDAVTTDQFKKAIKKLQKKGMKGLVLDLRDNPGGSLTTVCDIADLLLPGGDIVSTKDKNGKGETYKSDAEYLNIPMTVLINGQSASASEILAGAIQDYKLGTLIGTTTYGKGVVQQIYSLENGDSLKITVSEYFTPNGRSIHGVGVEPDIVVEYEKEDNQLEEAILQLKEEMNR